MEAVCWAVRRKKESLLLNATQFSRNKKLRSFVWRELQLEMQTPLSYKAERLYLCLPGTSQHPVYHSWIKLLLVSLSGPQACPCACVWQLSRAWHCWQHLETALSHAKGEVGG